MKKATLIFMCVAFGFLAGLFVNMKANKNTSYQIKLSFDTLRLYDGQRLVGMHIDNGIEGLKHGQFLDSIMTEDNR